MVQVPAAMIWTVLPLTVQTGAVVLLKLTASRLLEVALTAKSALPKVLLAKAPKLIAWFAFATVTFCVACTAGDQLVFPAWLAAMVQVPTPTKLTVLPLTVQNPVVVLVKITASPLVAAAVTV